MPKTSLGTDVLVSAGFHEESVLLFEIKIVTTFCTAISTFVWYSLMVGGTFETML